MKAALASPLLAAVDLGSNSFRLLLGKREGGQIVPVSTWRENVRLAAGLDRHGRLSAAKIREAEEALGRFAERLRALPPNAIRAVATSTYRVATNREELLSRSEAALGVPIEVVSGAEEARLIYLGCAHTLPWSDQDRLVFDVGGGSTEFIIGRGYTPELTESFPLGAVTLSQHFFPEGVVTASAFRKAELFVRSRLEVVPEAFKRGWASAFGSSGTVRALHEIVIENQFGSHITAAALEQLRGALVEAGRMDAVRLAALKPARAPVLPGGLAILVGLMAELGIQEVLPAEGALRLGALYDLLDRAGISAHEDPRALTVRRLQERYGANTPHAEAVERLAERLWRGLHDEESDAMLAYAAALHEIGMAIAHEDYHHHGAYIISHSELYGFSERERAALAALVLGHTGSLRKLDRSVFDGKSLDRLMCLRLAALFLHGRAGQLPPVRLTRHKAGYRLHFEDNGRAWLEAHPLTQLLLEEERDRWRRFGVALDWEP
ncbi:MAG: Ppx/GppA family phosphatase [Casimicrobiaceae bacterium]|nr:Ppx/GppA family phosphatase [Casimicrobiaceae bacterium]